MRRRLRWYISIHSCQAYLHVRSYSQLVTTISQLYAPSVLYGQQICWFTFANYQCYVIEKIVKIVASGKLNRLSIIAQGKMKHTIWCIREGKDCKCIFNTHGKLSLFSFFSFQLQQRRLFSEENKMHRKTRRSSGVALIHPCPMEPRHVVFSRATGLV